MGGMADVSVGFFRGADPDLGGDRFSFAGSDSDLPFRGGTAMAQTAGGHERHIPAGSIPVGSGGPAGGLNSICE